jgi:hypothetical protein
MSLRLGPLRDRRPDFGDLLDQDPGSRPLRHIFVRSKAAWFEICDGRPQFEEHAPDARA